MTAPKYPRLVVSAKRHQTLAKAAKKAGVSIAEHVEGIFKTAESKK